MSRVGGGGLTMSTLMEKEKKNPHPGFVTIQSAVSNGKPQTLW